MTIRTFARIVAVAFFCGSNVLLVAQAPPAKPTITEVVNAANRIPPGFPSWGSARGSLTAIKGVGFGPTERVTAGVPLPAPAEGLGGIKVRAQILALPEFHLSVVYVSDTEIGVLIPGDAPIGTGKVFVETNGVTLEGNIKVIESGIGIFNLGFFAGPYWGVAYKPDAGDAVYSDITRPAQAGEKIRLIGTGLGTSAPANLKVFMGTKEAEIVSSAHDVDCCDGIPAELWPLPRGVPGLDELIIVVPEGIPGCNMTVNVQTGAGQVSNTVFLAVAGENGECRHVNSVGDGEVVTVGDTATVGNISALQTIARATTGTVISEIGTEIATAQFIRFKTGQESFELKAAQWGYLAENPEPGACLIQSFSSSVAQPTSPQPAPPVSNDTTEFLDAGPQLFFENDASRRFTIPKNSSKTYGGGLGSSFSLPGLADVNNLFVKPDKIVASNGADGGTDIPAFNVSLNLPKPEFKWENIDDSALIRRDQPHTVRWSGGDPNGYVTILGSSMNNFGASILNGSFACVEKVSAGSFTIPVFALQALPPSGRVGPPPGTTPSNLTLHTYVARKVDVPNTDLTIFSAIRMLIKTTEFVF